VVVVAGDGVVVVAVVAAEVVVVVVAAKVVVVPAPVVVVVALLASVVVLVVLLIVVVVGRFVVVAVVEAIVVEIKFEDGTNCKRVLYSVENFPRNTIELTLSVCNKWYLVPLFIVVVPRSGKLRVPQVDISIQVQPLKWPSIHLVILVCLDTVLFH
jgi:hypothetical protein